MGLRWERNFGRAAAHLHNVGVAGEVPAADVGAHRAPPANRDVERDDLGGTRRTL